MWLVCGGSRASSESGLTVERCCGGVTAAGAAGAGLGAGALDSVAGCAGCGASVILVGGFFVCAFRVRLDNYVQKRGEQRMRGGGPVAVASQVLVEEGPTGAGVVEMVVTATSLWHRGRSHLTRNPVRRQKGQGRLFARFRLGSICSAHSVTQCTG